MEAIIRTENKTLFEALLQFLKSLHIIVETDDKKVFEKKTKNLAVKFRGQLPRNVATELQKHISQSRNQWSNS